MARIACKKDRLRLGANTSESDRSRAVPRDLTSRADARRTSFSISKSTMLTPCMARLLPTGSLFSCPCAMRTSASATSSPATPTGCWSTSSSRSRPARSSQL